MRHVLQSLAAATLIAAGLVYQAEAAVRRQIPAHIADRLDEILGPYQHGASQIVQVTLSNPDGRYVEGDQFGFEIGSRRRASYVYVDYFQLDGDVVHVLPSPVRADNFLRVGASVTIGSPNSEDVYDVLPPFGRELLVTIATSRPLFDEPRQEVEDGRGYLDALASELARAAGAGQEPAVVFRFIITYPRGAVLAETGPAETGPAETRTAETGTAEIGTAETGTAETGTAETGTAETGTAEIGTAVPVEPPASPAEAEIDAQSGQQQTTAPRPKPDTTSAAGEGDSAVAHPANKADVFYAVEVAPLLARMAKHPEDNEIATALAAAYGGYARKLSEIGSFTKARRILALAMALDLDNPEFTAIDKEVENAATAVQALTNASKHLASGDLDQAYEALVRAQSIAPDGGLVQEKLAEISPLVAQRLNEWGNSALGRGDLEEAKASWKRALSVDPRNAAAENSLDLIGAKAGSLGQ